MKHWRVCYLGAGGNVGIREKNIEKAVSLLPQNNQIKIIKSSSLYETSPVGPPQRNFINGAVKIRTTLSPHELLTAVKNIEKELGRKKTKRWGPRVIDIDILFYGKKIIKTRTLTIPHPRIAERIFVLEPLSEICPGLVHPAYKKTIKTLKYDFTKDYAKMGQKWIK